MKATNMLPTQRITYHELREAEAVKREKAREHAEMCRDKANARIAEIMAYCRAEEMQHASYLLGVIQHIESGHPLYLRLVAACEAESVDWRELVRYPGRQICRKHHITKAREAVILRLRATGMSYPEIATVLNTAHTTILSAMRRRKVA